MSLRLLHFLLWLGVAALAVSFHARIASEEDRLEARALEAARAFDAAQLRWSRWEGPTLDPELEAIPPVDPAAGRRLVRHLLVAGDRNRLLPRLASLPQLLERWYHEVPPAAMLDAEIGLLAWSRLPMRQLGRPLAPLTVAGAVALTPALEAEVRRRCPTGCPPLSGGDPAGLRRRLLALLDDPDEEVALAALDQLSQLEMDALPDLERRVKQEQPAWGRSLAFLALVRVVPETSRQRVLAEALEGEAPGLRLLAMLEAARLREQALLPLIARAGERGAPPGIEVVSSYVASLLRAPVTAVPAPPPSPPAPPRDRAAGAADEPPAMPAPPADHR